jgi:CheY-like chemotaxis protein
VSVIDNPPEILVADDNDQIRALVAETLREYGYHVLEAASGEEALALTCDRLALVVADIVMPPDGGIALVEALKQRVAGIKALFISGYGGLSAGSIGVDPVLSKPFTADELLSRVAALAPGARQA